MAVSGSKIDFHQIGWLIEHKPHLSWNTLEFSFEIRSGIRVVGVCICSISEENTSGVVRIFPVEIWVSFDQGARRNVSDHDELSLRESLAQSLQLICTCGNNIARISNIDGSHVQRTEWILCVNPSGVRRSDRHGSSSGVVERRVRELGQELY